MLLVTTSKPTFGQTLVWESGHICMGRSPIVLINLDKLLITLIGTIVHIKYNTKAMLVLYKKQAHFLPIQ